MIPQSHFFSGTAGFSSGKSLDPVGKKKRQIHGPALPTMSMTPLAVPPVMIQAHVLVAAWAARVAYIKVFVHVHNIDRDLYIDKPLYTNI